jgi:6-phosphogluconolactonase (cycloisomerase 2 family)
MKLDWFGRLALALFASLALGLGMSACGGGTIAYLWVLGQQYNQIASFKVDDYTGNLTQTPHQPFASQGTNPVSILVKSGGRFVYVLNQGTLPSNCTTAATCTTKWTGSGIAYFSVGGDGTLTYQQGYSSQGYEPVWMQFDSTSGYLYVLDRYSQSGDGNGSITVFSIDPTTGRLTLVLNTQSVPPNSPAPTYWEVGQNPLMMRTAGSCLFTVNSADQSITPFSQGGGGQLVNTTTGKIATGATDITSINGNGTYVVLTDAGTNQIIPYSIGSSCNLAVSLGGATANFTGTSNPVYSLIDTSGKYLYILNQSTTNTTSNQQFSSISGFLIQTGTSLSPLNAGVPFSVDAGPVCMVEDPTNKYMYVSDHNAGQVTGKLFDSTTGNLAALSRGSTFSATGLATCLTISGAVD